MEIRKAVESFHLSFCNRLTSKVDRKLFCLKGGCNLRFYFNSIRYSEDIDFDVKTISVDTLKKHVDKLLNEDAFRASLKNNLKIEMAHWSALKQTETTQRWKVSLQIGSQMPIPTKIEFSRRDPNIIGAEIRQVPPLLTTVYKLQPVLLQHYTLARAIEQKIKALIYRTETQARDVIDLHILGDQTSDHQVLQLPLEQKKKAVETLMSVSYDDFKSQVWPYLLPEYQEPYESKENWNQIQHSVVKFIEKQPETK